MASGDFVESLSVGGALDKVKTVNRVSEIGVIRQIDYPEHLVPDTNLVGTKGFRLAIDAINDTFSVETTFEMDIYISDINVTCSKYEDLDYWELEGNNKICESIYTLEAANSPAPCSNGFGIYPKITAGTPIKFSFYNGSGNAKIAWMTLGYMYKTVGAPPIIPEE